MENMVLREKKNDVKISIGEQEQPEQTSITNTPFRHQQHHLSTFQPISSSSFPTPTNKMSGDDRILINDISKAINAERSSESGNAERSQTKIQKLPETILKREMSEYHREPKAIAIGPFYANHSDLKKTDLKHRLAARFIRNSGKTGETLLPHFKKNFTADELKKLFKEKVIKGQDQDKLTRMLFLDGCSVLQFIDSYVNNSIKESDEISNGEVDEIRHDLFLLENQIPFKVLVVLMRLSNKGFDLAINLYRFVSMNIMAPVMYSKPRLDQKKTILLQQKEDKKQVFETNNNMPIHLLDLLRSELLFNDENSMNETSLLITTSLDNDDKCSFRNVQDLKQVGISLKPEYSKGLRSVSFSSRLHIFGQLNLPPLVVDESTKQKLLNLVALCLGHNDKRNYAVTSYLRLLDSLIDSEEDVKDMRSAHVLRNHLSSDQEVAQLFNSLGRSLVPQDAYSSVKKEIQKYYELKVVKWKAQLTQEYCGSPWAIVGVLAVLAGLLLTGIQTYYSVKPKK